MDGPSCIALRKMPPLQDGQLLTSIIPNANNPNSNQTQRYSKDSALLAFQRYHKKTKLYLPKNKERAGLSFIRLHNLGLDWLV